MADVFSNVLEFNLRLDHFATQDVPGLILLATKKLAFDIFAGVVQMTPVDTGRARNNWHMSLNTPDDVVLESATGGAPGQPPTQEHLSEQQQILAGLHQVGIVVWIQNNLVYAPVLEQGHSQQAPAGMVAVTLSRVVNQGLAEMGHA